jgi:hypothetical protein
MMRGVAGAKGTTTGVGVVAFEPLPEGAGAAGVPENVDDAVPVPMRFFAETRKE